MPIVNRSGFKLSVKKHPLWVRILLTPTMGEHVLVRDGDGRVSSGGQVYASCDWGFDAREGDTLPVLEQTGGTVRTPEGTFRLLPLEYLSSTYVGYDLVSVSREAPDRGHRSAQQPGGTSHPTLTLTFERTGGTGGWSGAQDACFKKCVWTRGV